MDHIPTSGQQWWSEKDKVPWNENAFVRICMQLVRLALCNIPYSTLLHLPCHDPLRMLGWSRLHAMHFNMHN
jgi:hypothetical protein